MQAGKMHRIRATSQGNCAPPLSGDGTGTEKQEIGANISFSLLS
jgi:hypothetical protein